MANTANQSKRSYHTVYKTTNLVNGNIYIGAHSTDDVNDDYIGSGTNINRAVKKYGRHSFRKEVLYVFETPEEMLSKEKEIVTIEFIKRHDVYNIVEGGYGGYNKGTSGLKHLYHEVTGERCAVHPNATDKMLEEGWKLGFPKAWNKGKTYVHRCGKKKVIDLIDLDFYVSTGWTKGLPESPTSGKTWIYNETSDEYSLCNADELATKVAEGWIKKKWAPVKKGSTWVNNGSENLRVDRSLLEEYLTNGWIKGMITTRWPN